MFGLGASGIATAAALLAGGADGRRLGRQRGRARGRRRGGRADRRSRGRRTGRSSAALVLAPGVPLTHPEPHWTVQRAQAAGVEVIGDIELFCRERRAQNSRRAVHRHHRHQRQVDDDGADRAHPARSRAATCRWAATSAPPILALEPPAPGRHPRHRDVVVPDRPDADARCRRSACCSTSRPTISTATARSSTTRP